MKEVIKEFTELLANAVTVICLMLASFLILINLYHYREVSYAYEARLSENIKYQEITTMMTNIEAKLNSVDTSTLPEQQINIGNNIKTEVNKCLTKLKESSLTKLAGTQYISAKDIYDTNMEMYTDINNVCLFYVGHYIDTALDNEEKLKNSFNSVKLNMEDERKQVLTATEYLRDRLLANSTYSFSSVETRNSVFNDRAADLALTILNYYTTVKVIDNITNWYVTEFGGAR